MPTAVVPALIDTDAEGWPGELDRLRSRLGAPNNRALFPTHFLKATLPKIGGAVAVFHRDSALVGAGFLFPRALVGGRRVYTLCFHSVADDFDADAAQGLVGEVGRLLGGAEVVVHDPRATQRYAEAVVAEPGITLGTPSAAEAAAIPQLQARIWGTSPDFLYPSELHSTGFAPGTTLVARRDGELVGFLFGFAKFGGSPLPARWARQFQGDFRQESQLLGVLPTVRQGGLGLLLKQRQGELAQQQGLGVINWTVDPLQFGNAVLNFGRLRAVAFDFYPDHYGFRNALNQVAASRFGITWLVQTGRVRRAIAGAERGAFVDLAAQPAIARANDAWRSHRLDLVAPMLAIEVPADWTAVQHRDLDEATRWRETTDAVFAHYLGPQPGQYAIVDVGHDGNRRYLLAERVTEEFLDRYGA